MRVMVVVKASADSEGGALPSAAAVARMGVYNDELIAAGVMVDGGGLKPSRAGKRIRFDGGKAVVIDGPFAETKELIGGYWIWQVKDLDDAVAWASRAPMELGAVLELRPYFEPEDFAGIATPDLIEQEKGWREDQLAKAPKP
jgi:hypothetical protein